MEKILAIKINDLLNLLYKRTDDTENIIIIYGLEIILNTVLKFAGVLILACLFHLLQDTLAMVILFSLLRIPAGGVHCETSLSCFLTYSIINVFGAFISKLISLPCFIYLPAMLINLCILFLFAPSETKIHKIQKNDINKKKLHCILLTVGYIVCSCFLPIKGLRCKTLIIVTSISVMVLPILNRKYHTPES